MAKTNNTAASDNPTSHPAFLEPRVTFVALAFSEANSAFAFRKGIELTE